MAHFAELDSNNLVLRVVVIANEDCQDDQGNESEEVGVQACWFLFGEQTIWKQTSYNSSIRKNYAGIGYTYDAGRDAFIPPKPFASWTLDAETCIWAAPVPYPADDALYSWNETDGRWQPAF
jgi:hypothetical protein